MLQEDIVRILILFAEWRRGIHPPVQAPRLPLLQLVGQFSWHEFIPQILSPCFRQAQSSDRNICMFNLHSHDLPSGPNITACLTDDLFTGFPPATAPPRNHRPLHQRHHAQYLRKEPSERGRP